MKREKCREEARDEEHTNALLTFVVTPVTSRHVTPTTNTHTPAPQRRHNTVHQ